VRLSWSACFFVRAFPYVHVCLSLIRQPFLASFYTCYEGSARCLMLVKIC